MVIQSQAGFDFTQFPAHSLFQAFQIGSGTKWRALSPLSERQVQPDLQSDALPTELSWQLAFIKRKCNPSSIYDIYIICCLLL